MAALTIKDIPSELYDALKQAAQLHRRSINSEVLMYLEKNLFPKRVTPTERLQRAEKLRNSIQANAVSLNEIDEAIHSGRP